MWKIAAVATLACAPLAYAGAPEQSIVVGAPKAQEFIVAMNCEPQICMDSFYRWSIAVERQVSGPGVPKRVRAVRVQHAENVFADKRPKLLFVLEPISDPAVRKRYQADYYIEAMGRPTQVFCLSGRSQEPDLSKLEPAGEIRGNKCYAEPPR